MPIFNIIKPFTVNFAPTAEVTDVEAVDFEAGVIEVTEKRILDHWYFKANAAEVKPKASASLKKALAEVDKLDDDAVKAALDAKKVDYPADADATKLRDLLKEAVTIEQA